MAEGVEAFGLRALVAVLGLERLDELRQVVVAQRVLLQGVMDICPVVVDPQPVRPRRLRGWLPVEEQHVRLDALGVEDAGRQPQERVNVAFVQELSPDGFPGSTLEENVVGHQRRQRARAWREGS